MIAGGRHFYWHKFFYIQAKFGYANLNSSVQAVFFRRLLTGFVTTSIVATPFVTTSIVTTPVLSQLWFCQTTVFVKNCLSNTYRVYHHFRYLKSFFPCYLILQHSYHAVFPWFCFSVPTICDVCHIFLCNHLKKTPHCLSESLDLFLQTPKVVISLTIIVKEITTFYRTSWLWLFVSAMFTSGFLVMSWCIRFLTVEPNRRLVSSQFDIYYK